MYIDYYEVGGVWYVFRCIVFVVCHSKCFVVVCFSLLPAIPDTLVPVLMICMHAFTHMHLPL